MKILIISQYAGTPDLGMVLRNYNWGVEFLKKGYDVTIVAGSYSHYRNKHPDMNNKKIKSEMIDRINFIWVKTPFYRGESNIGRIIAMAAFHIGLKLISNKLSSKNYDIVIASSPHPFVIYPAHSIAKKCKAKLIYDIRDLWPLTLRKLAGISKHHPFIMALQHAENYACRHADLVTATQQNAKQYLVSRGMPSENYLHVGNGFLRRNDYDLLTGEYQSFFSQLKNKNAFVIGYCGTLGKANAMHIAIESLAKATNKSIHLVMVGKGYYSENLKALSIKLNVSDRTHFLDPIPHNQIQDFLNNIELAYICGLNSRLYKYGISTAKMNDYMASAKPILYAMGDPKNPVELSGCGISCQAEDSDEIAKNMDIFSTMPEGEMKAMGERGYKWLIKNQTVDKQVDRILERVYKLS